MRYIPPSIILLLLASCGPRIHTETYDVWVRNDTAEPVTIGLVKDGPPFEVHWASPEAMATRTDVAENWLWGQTLAPGRTADTWVRGRFQQGVQAWLRVYRGEDRPLDELLSISRNHPGRLDLRLRTGRNNVVITDEEGQLRATRLQAPD